jgi:O-antigen/teichoic acid export membrane protein
MSTLKQRLIGNFGGTSYALFVTIISQLFSVPLFLHFWGKTAYGEWLVLSAVASYFGLTDIGFSKVTSNKMAMFVSANDFRQAKVSLDTTWVFITLSSVAVAIITFLVLPFLNLADLLNLHHSSPIESALTLLFLTLYALICLQGELLGAIYRSSFKNARGMVTLNTLRLLDFIVSMTTIIFYESTLILSLALLTNRFVGTLFVIWDCAKIAPHLKFGWKCASFRELKVMWKPSLAFMCFPIAHSIPSQGMTLLINAILGSSVVVVFNTIRILTRTLVHTMNLIKSAIWPEMSHLVATQDFVRARTMHRVTVQGTISLVSLGAILLLLFGPFLVQIWTQKTIVINNLTLGVFVLGVTLSSIWLSSAVVLEATNQHEGLAVRFLIGSLAALPAAALLVPLFGINGAILALMMIDCFLIPYVLSRSCKILNDRPLSLFKTFDVVPILVRRIPFNQ